jgi:hypothetical protein
MSPVLFFIYPSDSFMPQYSAIRHGWNIAFYNVEVGTAESSHCEPNDNIHLFLNFRFRFYFPDL